MIRWSANNTTIDLKQSNCTSLLVKYEELYEFLLNCLSQKIYKIYKFAVNSLGFIQSLEV
jgi:hypothetical protein